MGIRFYCPNGHKLNVKDFQAGQTGICPTCGAKAQIPLESTRPSSRHEKSQPSAAAPETPAAATPTLSAPLPTPAAAPATPAARPYSSAPVTFAAAPLAAPADPLATAGNVVWYVRPPSGGQFGPATTDLMRSWIAEGRVSTDTLVWREGWRDWQLAAAVFPQLSSGSIMPDFEAIAAEPISDPVHAHSAAPHVPPERTQLIALGVLIAIILFLLVIFLVLWLKQ